MDKRNSKESLLRHIEYLSEKLNAVYIAGIDGVEYVGRANYKDREIEAISIIDEAMYGEHQE